MVLIAGLSALLGSTNMSAQGRLVTAQIPFAFHIDGKTLPAGNYIIKRPSMLGLNVFQLNAEKGASAFVALGNFRNGNPDLPKLTFVCYGKECALAQISMPDETVTYAASDAALDKQFSRHLGMAAVISIGLTPR
jgi:hypothetical protein